ncbi:MAG: glycosyltransferase family 87 protein [Geobacteraceae bacterium]
MKQVSHSHNLIKNILDSREPGIVALKRMLLIATGVLGILGLAVSLQSLLPQNIYHKDFIQEYLLAKAALNGIYPYTPLPELADRLIGPLPNLIFQHPTPHPPPVILLSLPLGWLTYQHAAIVWFVFELACILVAAYLLLHWAGIRPNLMLAMICSLVLLVWSPFREELIVGQLMTLNLALLIGSWQMLRSGKEIPGGILLGSAIAFKLIAWPLAILLILRKRWGAIGATGTVLVAANGISALLVESQSVADYYLKVGPSVSSLYHSYIRNFSLCSIGWRVFVGTGSPALTGLNAPPLVEAPSLACYVSLILPVILLTVGLYLATRASTFDASFGIMTCVSLLVAPITWSHYLVLASIPMAIVLRRLFALDLPKKETNLAILLGLLLCIPQTLLTNVMLQFADQGLADAGNPTVPFAVTIVSLIPAAAIFGLMCLLRRVDQFPR